MAIIKTIKKLLKDSCDKNREEGSSDFEIEQIIELYGFNIKQGENDVE